MKYKWLLFDADNTLFDFTYSQRKALENSFIEFDLMFNYDYFDTFHDINLNIWTDFDNNLIGHEEIKLERFRRLFEALEIEFDDLVAFNDNYINQLILNSKLYEGVSDILLQLEGKTQMAIITNGMKEVQRPRFDNFEYKHLFNSVFISGEMGLSKPNYDFYEYVHKNTGYGSKSDYLVIGDNPEADIRGGKQYGFDTCWIRTLAYENIFQSYFADYEINNLFQLFDLLN